MRLFISVEINDAVRHAAVQMQETLRGSGADVRWVKPAQMHVTLAFLGKIPVDAVAGIKACMDETARKWPVFPLSFDEIGYFGSARAPRVVWMGTGDGQDSLKEIQADLTHRLRAAGCDLEDRPFHPHLTLGRIKARKNGVALTSAVASVKNARFGSVDIFRLVLMRSWLDPQGARYTIEYSARLKGATPHAAENHQSREKRKPERER